MGGEEAPFGPKVVHLPGTKLTPRVLLHRTLQESPHIKAIAVVIQWDDCTFDMDWSSMTLSEFCMAAMIVQIEAQKEMKRSQCERCAEE